MKDKQVMLDILALVVLIIFCFSIGYVVMEIIIKLFEALI